LILTRHLADPASAQQFLAQIRRHLLGDAVKMRDLHPGGLFKSG
jgi:hypothetical protein